MDMKTKTRWDIDSIQFPRLLAEIRAIGLTREQYHLLSEAMDLAVDDIDDVLERAETTWVLLKERT